jgi:hypothetical protein
MGLLGRQAVQCRLHLPGDLEVAGRDEVAAGQHHDGMMGAVGDNRDDRNSGTQGEPYEARPAGEVDLVPLGPPAASRE